MVKSQILGCRAGLAILFLALLYPVLVFAEGQPKVVVELFTSQACSNCAKADQLFKQLAKNPDLITLSYHVDYWDYVGIKDPLASSANTARQQMYIDTFGSGIYTPQLIINGITQMVGSAHANVLETIANVQSETAFITDIDITNTNGSILIDIGEGFKSHGKAHVILFYFKADSAFGFDGFDNNKPVHHHNVVTNYQTVGLWHGKAMQLEIPVISNIGTKFAVVVQEVDEKGRPGRILGAAQAKLPNL